jgi:hypothetical protein
MTHTSIQAWRSRAGAAVVLSATALGLAALPAGLPTAAASASGTYHFATPTRVVDTRAGQTLQPGVPFSVASLADHYVNVTALRDSGEVTLTFGSCDGTGEQRIVHTLVDNPQLFFVGDATCVSSDVTTDLLIDDVGYQGGPDGLGYVQSNDAVYLFDALNSAAAPVPAGVYPLDLAGIVPDDAAGIAVSVFAGMSGSSFSPGTVSIVPCGTSTSLVQVQFATWWALAVNVVHVARPVGTSLCLIVATEAPIGLAVLLQGYFTPSAAGGFSSVPSLESRSELRPGLVPQAPERVLDTRSGIGAPAGKVATGGVARVHLSGLAERTEAVTMTITATDADAAGYVTAYPCASSPPETSNLNFGVGSTVPNLVLVQPDLDGDVCLFTSARTNLLADLGGSYVWNTGMAYADEGPRRLLDTRSGSRVAAGSVTKVKVNSSTTDEAPAAATMNITAVGAGGWGYVSAYPCDQPRPEVSNLNYVTGSTVAALATVKLAADGTVCLYSYASTHLLVDLAGTYTRAATGRLALTSPTRLIDTREYSDSTSSGLVATFDGRMYPAYSGVSSVIANLTATGPGSPGFLTAYSSELDDRPNTSNLNFAKGRDVANLAFVPVARPGTENGGYSSVYVSAPTQVLVDVFARITDDLVWSTIVV